MTSIFVPHSSLLASSPCLTGARSTRWSSPASRRSLFPHQANGSLIEDTAARSSAPSSSASRSTSPRTSGAARRRPAPMPYNAGASSGTNPGPRNPALKDAVKRVDRRSAGRRPEHDRAGAGRSRDRVGQRPRSAHLARGRATTRSARVAQARGCPRTQVRALVAEQREAPDARRARRAARQRADAEPGARLGRRG